MAYCNLTHEEMDYSKLEGKIVEIYKTRKAFAEAMGVTPATINQRLSGAIEWKTSDMVKACRLLSIPLDKMHIYFFALKVEESQLIGEV